MSRSERRLHIEPAPDKSLFSVKVGFATGDRHHVDQHFGTAKGVLIYGVGKTDWALLEAIEYPPTDEKTHDKLPGRIQDLQECNAIYCNACGAAAIRQLMGDDINPVRVPQGTAIHTLLEQIQKEICGHPLGWLGQAIKSEAQKEKAALRLSSLMDEEW